MLDKLLSFIAEQMGIGFSAKDIGAVIQAGMSGEELTDNPFWEIYARFQIPGLNMTMKDMLEPFMEFFAKDVPLFLADFIPGVKDRKSRTTKMADLFDPTNSAISFTTGANALISADMNAPVAAGMPTLEVALKTSIKESLGDMGWDLMKLPIGESYDLGVTKRIHKAAEVTILEHNITRSLVAQGMTAENASAQAKNMAKWLAAKPGENKKLDTYFEQLGLSRGDYTDTLMYARRLAGSVSGLEYKADGTLVASGADKDHYGILGMLEILAAAPSQDVSGHLRIHTQPGDGKDAIQSSNALAVASIDKIRGYALGDGLAKAWLDLFPSGHASGNSTQRDAFKAMLEEGGWHPDRATRTARAQNHTEYFTPDELKMLRELRKSGHVFKDESGREINFNTLDFTKIKDLDIVVAGSVVKDLTGIDASQIRLRIDDKPAAVGV